MDVVVVPVTFGAAPYLPSGLPQPTQNAFLEDISMPQLVQKTLPPILGTGVGLGGWGLGSGFGSGLGWGLGSGLISGLGWGFGG